MQTNYYYYVTGLPDLLFDQNKKAVSFIDFAEEAAGQLIEADRELLETIRLPFDNANLINLIRGNGKTFDNRGLYSAEQLAAAIKGVESVPDYMQEFIDANRENRAAAPVHDIADQLTWLFYEYATSHGDPFISEYFQFDRDLRNVLAAINVRKCFPHLVARSGETQQRLQAALIGRNEVAEQILRSSAPDFGLGTLCGWVEQVVTLAKGGLIGFERGVDLIRWELLSDMAIFAHFGAEAIVAFGLKLLIVERWMSLDAAAGAALLDKLVNEVGHEARVQSP